MPPDVVQIGPFIISKVVFDVLVPLLSALFGTLIGGLVTYLAARAIENQKWQQQKENKLKEDSREALAIMLEWLDPIGLSLQKASRLVFKFQWTNDDHDLLSDKWPNLLNELAARDVPIRLQVLIPPELYERAFKIHQGLEELKDYALFSPQPESQQETMQNIKKSLEQVENLQQILSKFRADLIEAHNKTYL